MGIEEGIVSDVALASAVPTDSASVTGGAAPSWDVEVFFDGDCPLCSREIAMLRRRDRQHRIQFTDISISAEEFDPASINRTRTELMAEIHGRLADGTIISGVEVFRRLYSAVGFTRLVAITQIPGLSRLLDFGYGLFARNRLSVTGRRCQDNVCRTV